MNQEVLAKAYEPAEVESRWYSFWMARGYFRPEVPSSKKPPYCIVQPPPNVTGSLHLGHALTATLEDALIRWKRMEGYNCLWLPGTDHAGIATQMVVENELKRTEKKTRHDLGREEFVRRVWQWKEKYGARIGEQHKVLGASLDWSRERFTMDERSSAAVREVFVRLHESGLIYRAYRLINWCPSCLTALSDLEVEHEEREGTLWQIAYPVKGSDRKLVVATTRPETMLGDTAIAIHPDDPRYRGLAGKTAILPLLEREIPIIADAQLVNMEFGTGVVKVTPAHDFNDYETGLRHHLPMISIFDDRARTTAAAGPFAGLDRMEARKRVLEALSEKGLLVKEEPYKLSVGTCQRCETVVEPKLSRQWFVKIEPLAKPAIEAVEKGEAKFVQENWAQTYFHWMHNIHDWCISRQLWWGHQIPAYYCVKCKGAGKDEPIVSRQKPERCPHCGSTEIEQDPDVLDTWFSSALCPFSNLGWPEETPELKIFYPTSVMETGHDIIFFWVARMMMMGLRFMGKVPFRIIYLHAMIRDEKGEKMSKTKGNVIDPLDVVRGAKAEDLAPAIRNKFPQGMPGFGADALRFTLAALTQQGRDIKLSLDRVAGYKAFNNKLWNAARFALLNMGDFRWDGKPVKDRKLALADRWILARLNRAIQGTRSALENFDFAGAASTLYEFLWYEFCDWYIELSKISLQGSDSEARDSARAVLTVCLDQVTRLLHPFMPFITEEIWQKLPLEHSTDSIMIAPYPQMDLRLADESAEAEMWPVIAAIKGLRNIRGESNLSPAAKVDAIIQTPHRDVQQTLERWKAYLVPLAGLASVKVSGPGSKPAQAAAFVGDQMEIFVPLAGLLDLDEEKTRLQKEIAKVEADLASVSRKLENPNFVAKAPPDVVEKDRARIVELKQKSAKLAENLARIRPVPTPNPGNGSPEGAVEESRESGEGGGPKNNGNAVDLRGELDERLLVRNKDRAGTDHYELGVAYIGAGLADKAAEAFDAAEKAKAKPGRGKKLKPASAGRKASKRKTAKSKGRKVTKAKVRPKVRRNRKR